MMDEATFQKQLAELVAEIATLPQEHRAKLQALAEQTKKRHEDLKKTITNVHESLDFLRLCIKYLLFDLEATKRENGYLRRMLEQRRDESY